MNVLKRVSVTPIKLFRDNYCYLVKDLESSKAALIDPALESAMHAVTVPVDMILITHHHPDHCGQVKEVARNAHQFSGVPVPIIGGDSRIPGVSRILAHNESFALGTLSVTALHTPCHTSGHICFVVRAPDSDQPIVFTGDTLFAAGCGRFFEGSAKEMQNSLSILATLPPATLVYCGHEYTLSNLKFAASVDQKNPRIAEKLKWAESLDHLGGCTMPTTIKDELATNPFMRTNDPALQTIMGISDPVQLMHHLRELKNDF